MNIIASKSRWDKDGEFSRSILIVSDTDKPEIRYELKEQCHCEHDCCGHVQQAVTNIRPLSNNRFAVTLHGWRNI